MPSVQLELHRNEWGDETHHEVLQREVVSSLRGLLGVITGSDVPTTNKLVPDSQSTSSIGGRVIDIQGRGCKRGALIKDPTFPCVRDASTDDPKQPDSRRGAPHDWRAT